MALPFFLPGIIDVILVLNLSDWYTEPNKATRLIQHLNTLENLPFSSNPKLTLMAQGQREPDKSPIPTGASDWRKSALDALNAHYNRHDVFDFEFDGLTIPNDVQNGEQLRFGRANFYRYRYYSKRIRACK